MLRLMFAAGLLVPQTLAPADDPDFQRCVKAEDGVQLRWTPPDAETSVWLVVKRRSGDDWKTWVKTYVKSPPFTLTLRTSSARNGEFAWLLFAVNKTEGQFTQGEWQFFCTRE